MNRVAPTRKSVALRWMLPALLAAAAFGCAADEPDESEQLPEETSSQSVAEQSVDPNAQAADETIEKGLRRDFCCAVKSGNYVEYCTNMHDILKVRGLATCSPGDNVLRDGKCSKYSDCSGKTY